MDPRRPSSQPPREGARSPPGGTRPQTSGGRPAPAAQDSGGGCVLRAERGGLGHSMSILVLPHAPRGTQALPETEAAEARVPDSRHCSAPGDGHRESLWPLAGQHKTHAPGRSRRPPGRPRQRGNLPDRHTGPARSCRSWQFLHLDPAETTREDPHPQGDRRTARRQNTQREGKGSR